MVVLTTIILTKRYSLFTTQQLAKPRHLTGPLFYPVKKPGSSSGLHLYCLIVVLVVLIIVIISIIVMVIVMVIVIIVMVIV